MVLESIQSWQNSEQLFLVAVIYIDYLKLLLVIVCNLVMPTGYTTDAISLAFFSRHYPFLHFYSFKGYLVGINWWDGERSFK